SRSVFCDVHVLMNRFQFHPAVARWFEQMFGSPTEPQTRGWPEIQAGRHVLISAPTGSGKTLAAFLASLDRLFREGAVRELLGNTEADRGSRSVSRWNAQCRSNGNSELRDHQHRT